jgi:hypothetical protein
MRNADEINKHLADGGVVQVTTYLRSTVYDRRHVGFFLNDKKGDLHVKHGRGTYRLTIGDHDVVGIRLFRFVSKEKVA